MIVAEQISRELEKLPGSLQQEVLHFVEFLSQKARQTNQPGDEATPLQKAKAWEEWTNGHRSNEAIIVDDRREIIYED